MREGLQGGGFVEGQNVVFESRFAENQTERLPALAAELVRRPVAVIVANSLAAAAAKGCDHDDSDRLRRAAAIRSAMASSAV